MTVVKPEPKSKSRRYKAKKSMFEDFMSATDSTDLTMKTLYWLFNTGVRQEKLAHAANRVCSLKGWEPLYHIGEPG